MNNENKPGSNFNRNIYIAIAGILFVIFTFLKIKYIITVPLWHDEGLTLAHILSPTFRDMLSSITSLEQNPFLFFFFERSITNLSNSTSPSVLRLLPFIFSVLSPVALYFLYRRSFNDEKGAFIAGTFLYISEFFTFMTCDARMYSQTIFFIIMGMIFYLKLMNREKNSFIPFFLFWTLAVFSHYLALVALIILLIHHLIFNRGKNDGDFLLSSGLIFLTFIPEGLRILVIMKNPVFMPGPARYEDGLELFYISITGFALEFPHMAVWYSLCLISMALVIASLFAIKKSEGRSRMPAGGEQIADRGDRKLEDGSRISEDGSRISEGEGKGRSKGEGKGKGEGENNPALQRGEHNARNNGIPTVSAVSSGEPPSEENDVSNSRRNLIYLFFALFLGIFLVLFVPAKFFNISVFSSRHLILCLPFYCILISLTLSRLSDTKAKFLVPPILALLITVNFLSTYNAVYKPKFYRNDFRTVSGILRQSLKEGDAVMLIHGYQSPLLLHYLPELNRNNFISIEKGDAEGFSLRRLQRYKRVWVVLSDPFQVDPKMVLPNKIHNGCKYIQSYRILKVNGIYNIFINLYETVKE